MKKIILMILGLYLSVVMSQAGAVTLSLLPASQTANSGDSISLDLVIDGLGEGEPDSLGDFDIDIAYDMSVLSFNDYSLGDFLGDTLLGEALDISLGDLGGIINIGELSFLEPDALTCIFCIAPYLDDIQPSSFTLATLDFMVDLLVEGASTIVSIDAVNALGDGFGVALPVDSTTDAVISNPAVGVPEPGTMLLISFGLVAWVVMRRRPRIAV